MPGCCLTNYAYLYSRPLYSKSKSLTQQGEWINLGRKILLSKYAYIWQHSFILWQPCTSWRATGGREEGVGLSRPFTQEEGKYKIQFVTDELMDRGILLLDHERVKFNVFFQCFCAVPLGPAYHSGRWNLTTNSTNGRNPPLGVENMASAAFSAPFVPPRDPQKSWISLASGKMGRKRTTERIG